MTDIYIVDGARTPFIKATTNMAKKSASDIAVAAAQQLLLQQSFSASELDEVITGCVMPHCDEANISRIISLRIGCGATVPAWTVQRNCASGLQAIDAAYKNILAGTSGLVLAGGVEAMSRAPVLLQPKLLNIMQQFSNAKNWRAKLKVLLQLRLQYLKPIIGLRTGLTDSNIGLNMGETAEKLAYQYNITRKQMDEYAVQSHKRAAESLKLGDDGIRADSSIAKLSKLKPVFTKNYGSITAGNSSQISDGAAFVLMANESALKKHNLQPLAKVIDIAWSGLDPSIMGLGPAYAIRKLLKQQKLDFKDIDYWEINEAFAAQVLACIKELGENNIPHDRLNIAGGAIAIGHPVGASGARIALQLALNLQQNNARYGIASLCIGGGQGGAILLENVNIKD